MLTKKEATRISELFNEIVAAQLMINSNYSYALWGFVKDRATVRLSDEFNIALATLELARARIKESPQLKDWEEDYHANV